MKFSFSSYAKINLFLSINQQLENGYHDILSIFQNISLADQIILEESNKFEIQIIQNNQRYISDDSLQNNNLLKKVWELFHQKYNIPKLKIKLKKNIPIGAGLGGGSSNAASFANILNKIYQLQLNRDTLIKDCTSFGADIPFFIYGGTAVVKGIGEKIFPILNAPLLNMVIIYPNYHQDTAKAYKNHKEIVDKKKEFIEFVKFFNRKDFLLKYDLLAELSYNCFQKKTIARIPPIKKAMEALKRHSDYCLMSGSGSSVFAVFKEQEQAKICYEKLSCKYSYIFLAKSINEKLD